MPNLATIYQSRLAEGNLRPDAAQQEALKVLQVLADALQNYRPRQATLLNRFFFKPMPPKGLYIYGDVGRGKSMLMDLFFEAAPVEKKRRVHFHQFMLEIQARLHRLQESQAPEVLPRLAQEIAAETGLLCFDEFHVANIADAMILGRLFEALFAAGVVVVATSNWRPQDLYKNGLQRERFLPFISLIEQRMNIYHLRGDVDHRYEQTQKLPGCFSPLSGENTRKLQGIFFTLTDNTDPQKIELPVQGRVLLLTHAAKGVGFFNFDELCVATMGSADFLAIASSLHTVLIDGVPKMEKEKRNETERFINLIDALYEARVQLYMTAAVPPEQLAPQGDQGFSFQRTISRLMEMQGEEYRKKPHLGG